MITPACFIYFQASRDAFRTKSNRIMISSIVFDVVRLVLIGSRESNSQQIRCLISFDYGLSSVEFWFDFVRLDTPGSKGLN